MKTKQIIRKGAHIELIEEIFSNIECDIETALSISFSSDAKLDAHFRTSLDVSKLLND